MGNEPKRIGFSTTFDYTRRLNKDIEEFRIRKQTLFNELFKYYSSTKLPSVIIKDANISKLQFNLNIANSKILNQVIIENGYSNKTTSDYFRALVQEYLSNPRCVREKIVFNEIVNIVKLSKKNNKKVNFKYDNKIETLIPLDIVYDDSENKAFYIMLDDDGNVFKFRLSRIKDMRVSIEEIQLPNSVEFVDVMDDIYKKGIDKVEL